MILKELAGDANAVVSRSIASMSDPPAPLFTVREVGDRTGAFWLGAGVSAPAPPLLESPIAPLTWAVSGEVAGAMRDIEPTDASLFGVMAHWRVTAGSGADFLAAAVLNALTSVAEEDGCILFGVISSAIVRDSFALVELFVDAEAFSQHLETPHFIDFAQTARPLFVGDRADTVRGDARWTP